eukprot:6253330-Amphidinium_carterae.1
MDWRFFPLTRCVTVEIEALEFFPRDSNPRAVAIQPNALTTQADDPELNLWHGAPRYTPGLGNQPFTSGLENHPLDSLRSWLVATYPVGEASLPSPSTDGYLDLGT